MQTISTTLSFFVTLSVNSFPWKRCKILLSMTYLKWSKSFFFFFFKLNYAFACGLDGLCGLLYLGSVTRFNWWQFEQKANEVVAVLPWVKNVNVTMSAQPARPIFPGQLPVGLQKISNIVAVSSCKVDFPCLVEFLILLSLRFSDCGFLK